MGLNIKIKLNFILLILIIFLPSAFAAWDRQEIQDMIDAFPDSGVVQLQAGTYNLICENNIYNNCNCGISLSCQYDAEKRRVYALETVDVNLSLSNKKSSVRICNPWDYGVDLTLRVLPRKEDGLQIRFAAKDSKLAGDRGSVDMPCSPRSYAIN